MATSAISASIRGGGEKGNEDKHSLIVLDNGTDCTLGHIYTVLGKGQIMEQMPPLLQRGIHTMVTTRSCVSLPRTDGIVTLKFEDTGLALAIVWCVPCVPKRLSAGLNSLAIGIYDPRYQHNPKSILKFVKENKQWPDAFLRYTRQDYRQEGIQNLELDYDVKILAYTNDCEPGGVIVNLRELTTGLASQLETNHLFIRDGRSLHHTTIDNIMAKTAFRVVGVIEIENFTEFQLTDPRIQTDGGNTSLYPKVVESHTREAVVVHKRPFTATGSYGTLSFYIKELDCRVVLMWSLPFNHTFYSNCLALDVREGREIDHSELFAKMYYGNDVVRTKYGKEFRETSLNKDGLDLTSFMTSSHCCQINLKVERMEGII